MNTDPSLTIQPENVYCCRKCNLLWMGWRLIKQNKSDALVCFQDGGVVDDVTYTRRGIAFLVAQPGEDEDNANQV